VIVMFARRGLRETRRFAEQAELRQSLWAIWNSPYRRRMLEMSAIWFLTYIATQNAVSVWKDYAMNDLGWLEKRAAFVMQIGAVVALPLAFFAGKLLDVAGRKVGAVVILGSTAIGVAGSYTATSIGPLVVFLILTVLGVNSSLTVLNALTAELFPTSLRGNAFAWSNNILGRIGYWGSPFVIGAFVDGRGWGPVLRVTSIFPLLALALVLWLLPETRSKELEETARV
jgi:putative MFS transporter